MVLAFNLRAAITSLPPVFPELAARLRLSPAEVTVLSAVPVLCFGLVSAPAARLSRWLGEERVLLAALAALACGLLLRAGLPAAMLFPGTILACGAIAIMNVLLASLIKRRRPAHAGLLIGIYLLSLYAGGILGSLLSVPAYRGSGGSVRVTLGLWALPAVAAVAVWLPQAIGRSARIPKFMDLTLKAESASRSWNPLRHAVAWQVTVFMGLQSLNYYALLSWLPTLFRSRGATPGRAGDLVTLMNLGGALTVLLIPVVAQRLPGQRMLVVPTIGATAAGTAAALWAPLGTAAFWMILLGLAQGSAFSLAIFFTIARAPDPVAAASLSAFMQSIGYLLASAGPLAVGFLHAATGSWTIPVLVILSLTGAELAAGWLAARSRVPVSGEAPSTG
jgi:CP family cyanate transporter-like MFS transporter